MHWRINWRALECWCAGACLFLQTGAILPLMLLDADESLSQSAKSFLRMVNPPTYAFAALVLLRNAQEFLLAIRRNLLLPSILGLSLISVVWSVSPSLSLIRALGLIFSLLLAYALAIRFTPRQLRLIIFYTLAICVSLSMVVLILSPSLARMPLDGSMRGVFVHKNGLGWYSSIALLTSTAMLTDRTMVPRWLALVMMIVSGLCLVGSGSMTAMIATASAYCLVVFYWILQRSRDLGRIAWVLLFLHLVAGVLLVLHQYLVPFLEAIGKDATLTGRVPLWELVDRHIGDHLLLGFGYQAFWTDGNPAAWTIWSKIMWQSPHAHNGFRDILLSFGILGLTPFVIMVVRALRHGAMLQCADQDFGWLWLNVMIGMVITMNFTESIFLAQNDAIFILFSACIIMTSLYAPVALAGRRYPAQLPAGANTGLSTS